MSSPPTYWDYLGLDRLLDSQRGLEAEEVDLAADELHFIVVHQTFELWFKMVIREIRLSRDRLAAPEVPEPDVPFVVRHLRRVHRILDVAADGFKVMETLTPLDFLDFRDKLIPSSGFQSFQMREIEILLGLESSARKSAGLGDPLAIFMADEGKTAAGRMAKSRIEAALTETTLKGALHAWLQRTPIQGSRPQDDGDEAAVQAFIDEYLAASELHGLAQIEAAVASGASTRKAAEARHSGQIEGATEFLNATDVDESMRADERRLRAAILFVESYRELPLLAWPRVLIDAVVELEELLVLFRTRHVRMVERIIGRRSGTGGSAGVDYLERTLRYRIFNELWAVRTVLLPKHRLPRLRNQACYEFAGGRAPS